MSNMIEKPPTGGQIVNLVLFFCSSRTGHFGQGTFVDTVLSFAGKQKNLKITIIKTDLKDQTKEIEFRKNDHIDYLLIPQPQNGFSLHAYDDMIQQTYAKRIIDISMMYLEGKSNVIFWVNSVDYLNIVKELKSRFNGVQVMYVHHAWSWKHFNNISDEAFGKMILKEDHSKLPKEWIFYQKEMAALADKTITVTKHAKYFFERFMSIDSDKISVIYNGIDPVSILSLNKGVTRRKYGFAAHEQIIVYAGRITEEKGLPFVLKAFRQIAENRENVRLVVVGNGRIPEFISYVSPHWSKVVYTGELHKDQVFELYSIADVGVQPSLIEQCSFTAIEMCYHRVPLVVSADIGLDEMFEDGIDALKVSVCYDEHGVKYLDHMEIAEKVSRLLDNPQQASSMGGKALEKAHKLFNIEGMAAGYLKIFNDLSLGNSAHHQ